ncbi:MAG: hemerythrin family protein [Prolixibacteraceae bacterium]|nr:hemerythrin family protein [Prolixibacteraceae bacterium]
MDYIRWKDDYSVDIATIDDQHKELFRLINAFYSNIMNKSNKEAMWKVIEELETYVYSHFATEEALMLKANYPNYNSHKAEHESFKEKVIDFKKRYNEGRLLLSIEVTRFIKDWITVHIMQTDHQYKGKI